MKRTATVGMLGCGVVGGSVVRLLSAQDGAGCRPRNVGLRIGRIAVRDVAKPRDGVPPDLLTDNPQSVVDDPGVDVIAEVMGGIEPARSLLLRAIAKGKSVVTANKALLSTCGDELFRAAYKAGVHLMFEASVAGGIPIVKCLREGLAANKISSVYGILNGTTNYILTKMTEERWDLETALREAQNKGFAEPDPTMDINGTDAAHKLAILARIAFGGVFRTDQILTEGIDRISQKDIEYARELGYAVKLLAIAKKVGDDGIDARVHPAMIPSGSLLADIRDEFNAIEVVGDAVGTQVFYGKGAGGMPTASAVVSDLLDLADRRLRGAPSTANEMFAAANCPQLVGIDDIAVPYYLRFVVVDKPGVLAAIARVLAADDISIWSVIQKARSEASSEGVPLVIMTHRARERSMRQALGELNALDVVRDSVQVIRVEEL